MNIWILNHYATPPDTPGSTRHFDFATEFVRQGHQVSIFASGFSHRMRKEERLEGKQRYRRENIDGVEFVWIKTSPYYGGNDKRRVINMLSYALRVIPLAVKSKGNPDVILASSPHPFAGLAGFIIAKMKRAQFIFEVRDLWPETFVEIGGYSRKSLVVRLLVVLERFLYRRASRIITVLPKLGDYIIKLRIGSDKICYIPNGVSPELFGNICDELPRDLATLISVVKSNGGVIAGYTGAHGKADALDTVVEAAKILHCEETGGIHFLLVGDGTEKGKLSSKAENLGLTNMDFLESIPKKAIPTLLQSIDIGLLTKSKTALYAYGMSFLKIFDYMMCAKPVVWAVDSINNPVAEANCGITVPPEEPEELAKAIVTLSYLSDEERQEIGMRGHEYVMKYHSTPVLANKLLQIMQDVM